MAMLHMPMCLITSCFWCSCIRGYIQHGNFEWLQIPYDTSMMYLRSGQELTIGSQAFGKMDKCLYEYIRVLWTDENTGIIYNGIRTQNRIILHERVYKDDLWADTHVELSEPPEGINITAFDLGFDNIKQQYQSYMTIILTKEINMTHFWNIQFIAIQTCVHYNKARTSKVFKETFYVANDPLHHVKVNIMFLGFDPQIDEDTSLNLLNLKYHVQNNLCWQPTEQQTEFSSECFHDNTELIVGNTSKYTVNVSSGCATHNSAKIIVRLNIANFTVHDFGEYWCDVDILCAGNKSLKLRKLVVSIDPCFETIIGNYDPAVLILSEKAEIRFSYGVVDTFFPKVISGLHRWAEITAQIKKRTSNIWTFTILVVEIAFFISIAVWVIPYVQNRQRRLMLAQLKALLTINRNACIPENNTSYIYDVFISHDPRDSPFVREQLLPDLERAGYRVCYGPRDFQPNRSQIFNSGDAIENSRRTIFIFSPAYYKNDWCTEMELVSVYTGILNNEGPTDRMVIILHKKCKMPDILREYTYLDWMDSVNNPFNFEKLKQALGE